MLIFIAACQSISDREWQRRYSECRKKLWYGYFVDSSKDADQYYRESTKTSEAWASRFQILEAQALIFQGRIRDAQGLLKVELPSSLPSGVRAQRAIVQADALCRVGERASAQAILSQAGPLIYRESSGIQSEFALTRGRCAEKPESAREFFSLAASLAHGNDEFVEAAALLNIGFGLLQEERYAEAIEKFTEGLNVTASPLLRNRLLGNVGFAYSQLGDWRRAISFSKEAVETAAEIKNDDAQVRWLIDLGKAHFALWELPEAQDSYERALLISQRRHDTAATALCLHDLTLLAIRKNEIQKADDYRSKGEALNVGAEKIHFAFDAAEIAAARKDYPASEIIFRGLLRSTDKDPVTHSMVQHELGKALWGQNKLAEADKVFRAGITDAETSVSRLKRPEFRMSFMDRDPFYDSYIQFLVTQKKPIEALKVAERGRAQVIAAALENGKAHDPSISVSALQVLAKSRNCVILSYSMTDQASFLWVITSSLFKVFELPGHYTIGLQIIDFNREIQQHAELAVSPAATKLYEMLVHPAEELIPHGSHVVIIPSKALAVVNFEALVAPKPQPHYWVEDVDIEVAGSLALLAGAQNKTPSNMRRPKELFALGAPVEATKDFPVLQHAPEEMQKVQSHFPSDRITVISGKDAVPRAYGASNPGQYRFLHLDTHGIASDMNPLESAIILSPATDNSYKLSAQEIKDIPLHADLVTISACYGAGTRWYQGEGIVGLGWAFLRAGAHQVIAALWEVDDASSPQLMDDFYGELVQGKPASEALRDAKLKMLHSSGFHRHPYYWASLQVYTGS